MIERVINILADFTTIKNDKITEKSKLTVDLGLSSLDVINVVVAFEDEFDIEISPIDIVPDNFKNVDAIYALVQRLQED